jgi:hypothetical protein
MCLIFNDRFSSIFHDLHPGHIKGIQAIALQIPFISLYVLLLGDISILAQTQLSTPAPEASHWEIRYIRYKLLPPKTFCRLSGAAMKPFTEMPPVHRERHERCAGTAQGRQHGIYP